MEVKTENLQDAVSELIKNRQPLDPMASVPPPPPAPMFVQNVMNTSKVAGAGISLLVSITYLSMSGNMRQRDVLIRRLIQGKGEYYIDGVVMDKKAPRLIKLSNIREIRDISSGHVYTDPYEFVQSRLGVTLTGAHQSSQPINDFAKVVERTGYEMTVLMYLVAIDGQRDRSERDKVIEYIRSRTTDLSYTSDELNEYLVSLAPNEESFTIALAKVLSKEQSVVQSFVEAILDVIMADGRIDDRERSFLVRILDLLEQDGYDIKLPI